MMRQLLILSKDAVFARMLELEFRMQGLTVLNAHRTEQTQEAELTLIDLDSILPPSSERYGRMIGFTRNFSISSVDPDRRCSMIFHRPFEIRLLRDEVTALLSGREAGSTHTKFILEQDALSYGERRVSVSPKERVLLERLLSHRGEIVSKESIFSLIGESSANKAEVYICYLRKKLETLTGHPCIRTVRGRGYLLNEP